MELIAEKIMNKNFNEINSEDLKLFLGEEESLELEFKQMYQMKKAGL